MNKDVVRTAVENSTKVHKPNLPPDDYIPQNDKEKDAEEFLARVFGNTAGVQNFPGDTKKIVAGLAYLYAELKDFNYRLEKLLDKR